MAEKRLGNQNPTQSVILPYTESLSDEAIAIYEKTGLKSYPWQKNLVKSIMAVDDDDGLWVHQKFGFSIPRRNGKTEIIYILERGALSTGLTCCIRRTESALLIHLLRRSRNILKRWG